MAVEQDLREPGTRELLDFSGGGGAVHASLQSALGESFEWGLELAAQACNTEIRNGELWDALIGAWGGLDAADERWSAMLKLLIKCEPAKYSQLDRISSVLERKVSGSGAMLPSLLPDALQLADDLWELSTASEQEHTTDSSDWLTVAINTPAGSLMSFYLHSLSRLSAAEQGTKGISDRYKTVFLSAIQGTSFAAEMARIPLAAQITFLAILDEGWTIANVLPLLDTSIDARRARLCWHGYVMWGRWTHTLIPHLLPLFEQQFVVLGRESSEYRRVFCERMADIAVFSEINPIDSGWLFRFVQAVSVQDRLSWVRALEDKLQGLDDQPKVATWTRWLRMYWERRNAGVPLQFAEVEAAEMAKITFTLEPAFDEAIELLRSGPRPDLGQLMIYYSLNQTGLANRKSEATGRLLQFLLGSEGERQIYDIDKLEDTIRQLITAKAPKGRLIAIIDELAHLGSTQAAQLRKELDSRAG